MENIEDELGKKDLAALMSLASALKGEDPKDPDVLNSYRAIGNVLIDRAEPLLAFPVIDEALRAFPHDDRLRQLLGLALARSGAAIPAHRILDGLYQEELNRAPDTSLQAIIGREETLSMLARVYKDFGLESWPNNRAEAIRQWETSLQLYTAAYSLRMDYFPGINAAAVATMLGRHEAAKHTADDVGRQTLGLLDRIHAGQASGDLYWLNATLGEAFLITRDLEQAEIWYAEAAKIGLERRVFGKMGSTLRQLKSLLAFLALDDSVADQFFPMPRVGVCAGHMVDQPGRSPARFPESVVPRVREEIRAWLDREQIRIGFSSGACGADLLFLDSLLEKGGEAHMILPFDQKIFCETSVTFGGKTWVDCYRRVLERSVVKTVSDRPLNFGEVAYDHANQIIHGLAVIYAQRVAASLRHLAVWNGEAAAGLGGTGDVVSHWQRLSQPIDVLKVPNVQPARPLEQVVAATPGHSSLRSREAAIEIRGFGARVVAVLFADVVSFGKMSEDQMPIFIEEFLNAAAEILDRGQFCTIKRNTWGDGLFLAFETIADAGRFALDLSNHVKTTDWKKKGLPENFGLRTALHAGPVYLCIDPITRLPNCIGTQVSHAARIEPITPVNEVYASEVFAALAASEGITDFVCRYVGHIPLAKDHGIYATYHVTRSTNPGAAPPPDQLSRGVSQNGGSGPK
jgi:class 3 adenylate cyclase/tetratricopeptide (TPR) repeat protein